MSHADAPRTNRGGIWGCLIGDACGVPYEFHPPGQIPPAAAFTPPPGFPRAHAGTPPGTWSDDGAHALCLLASLLSCDRLDLDDLGRRLLAWYEQGYMAVDGRVFDVGIQTDQAVRALRQGKPADQAAPADERANGNGRDGVGAISARWQQALRGRALAEPLIADLVRSDREIPVAP